MIIDASLRVADKKATHAPKEHNNGTGQLFAALLNMGPFNMTFAARNNGMTRRVNKKLLDRH